MLAYIAIFLSALSIILMIIILIRFKKLFSTEQIIEKTKRQMNRVIVDVNNNANRDIELINEATKRTRALLNDADRKMEQFREASQILRDTIAEAEKVKSTSTRRKVIFDTTKSKENLRNVNNQKFNSYINPNAAYEIRKDSDQGTLFDDDPSDQILKDETKVTPEGAAYKEVPLIITKIYDDQSENQNKMNKSLNERVEKLFRQGMNVDDIATELSCSIAEVQFIIDML